MDILTNPSMTKKYFRIILSFTLFLSIKRIISKLFTFIFTANLRLEYKRTIQVLRTLIELVNKVWEE